LSQFIFFHLFTFISLQKKFAAINLDIEMLWIGHRPINDAFIFIYTIFHFPCDTYVRNRDIWSQDRRICTLPRGILNAAGAPDCLFIQAAHKHTHSHIYTRTYLRIRSLLHWQ